MVTQEMHIRFGNNGRYYLMPEIRPIDTGFTAVTLRLLVSMVHGRLIEFSRVDLVQDPTRGILEHYHIHEMGCPDGANIPFDQEKSMLEQMHVIAERFREILAQSGYPVDDETTDDELAQAIVCAWHHLPQTYPISS